MPEGPPFELFGPSHVVVLTTILLLCFAMSRVTPGPGVGLLPKAMAVVLLTVGIAKPLLFIFVFEQPWERSLPLDLCRINEFFCVYLLLARSYRTFEVAYFLAVAGSVTAMLTPDLRHGFPDPRFLMFFASHGASVLAALYGVFGYGFRPTLKSVGVIVVFLGAYTLIMAGVNVALDANYLFLCTKPEGASILDYLGPWPWYVLALMAIAVVACFVCYLPFAFTGRKLKAV